MNAFDRPDGENYGPARPPRRALTALGLAVLAATFLACSGRPAPPQGPQTDGTPVFLSAKQLGQELYDDPTGTCSRYAFRDLHVEGVVGRLVRPKDSKEAGPQDFIRTLVFLVPVTDRKTSETKEYAILCAMGPYVTPAQREAAGLAKGKPIAIRGRIFAVSPASPQASLNACVLATKDGGQ